MMAADYLERLAEAKRAVAKNSRHSTELIRDALALEAAAADLRAGLHLSDEEDPSAVERGAANGSGETSTETVNETLTDERG